MAERIQRDGITSEASYAAQPEYGFDGNWYSVRLTFDGRSMVTPFGMGPGLSGYPSAADVLSSLVSDAAGYENAQDFSDWASEYGYDDDSRRAYAIYEIVAAQTDKLRAFLGDEYDAYLWETDGD
jgi:hypothetical protein